MEVISSKDLLGLPVYTQSGHSLGKVSGLELDKESQKIINYQIKPSSIIKELLSHEHELIVSVERVIEITAKKMIVEDLVLKEKEEEKGKLDRDASPIPLG